MRRREVVGVRGREADASEARHPVDPLEERREIGGRGEVAPVGVDGLAEQRDLAAAVGAETADLVEDRLGRVAALAPARGRHHAERAVLLAPLHHGHVGAQTRRAVGPRGDLHQWRLAGLDDRAPLAPHALDQARHLADGRRAEHEIDDGRPPADLVMVKLRHASHHAHDHVRPPRLDLAQFAELREDLVFGLLADRAGVEEDEVGVRFVFGQLVRLRLEQPRHPLGVVLVHLTAVRDEMKFRHA
jgi:hypothetical protein